MGKRNLFFTIGLFVILLTVSRLIWLEYFMIKDQPQPVNGVLDLREWEGHRGKPITLDGEWALYPFTFATTYDDILAVENRRSVHVPDGWNEVLQDGVETPYGFGTYHLRILMNPGDPQTYSIFVPSVRSSSRLFINGHEQGGSGLPAEKEEEYIPTNIAYTVTFTANKEGVIDVVLQAANYLDSRSSGLIRSLKFGTEVAVQKERQLSIAMQLVIAIALIIHAIYTAILFFMNRDKKMIYFSVLLISTMFIILNSSEDKILQNWIMISYKLSFKMVFLLMIISAYSLLQCTIHFFPSSWRKKILTYATIMYGSMLVFMLALPHHLVNIVGNLFACIVILVGTVIVFLMVKTALKDIKDNLLLTLSVISFMNHFLWWGIILITGVKVVYYPFDLVIALIIFSVIWFQRYFKLFEEQKKLTAELKQVDKVKDEFLVNTSHELRNPLHGILNISQVVLEREKSTLSVQSMKDLEMVHTVGRRMSLLLNDLLDVTRLQEGGIQLRLRSLSIQTIADGVIAMVRFLEEGTSIDIKNEIPIHFPHVVADENRLIQILFNLLHNALKFTKEGEVTISASIKKGKACIAVQDSGIGMSEEVVKHIFEPYKQGEHDGKGGIGIGLSVCKNLVNLHGGTIDVQSTLGVGSTFTFTLELADEAIHSVEAKPSVLHSYVDMAMEQQASKKQLKEDRPRILAVDDDSLNLKILERLLPLEEYELETVTSAKETLALIEKKEWDLIIADVMMPEMSGYELTKTIRESYTLTGLPILLLTARSRPEDIEYGFLIGANDYVVKPIDMYELRSRVWALTQYKKSIREQLKMETAWLHAQIEPHFFFNTLNTISAFSEIDIERMQKLLERFTEFLHGKFSFRHDQELIPIEEELEIVRSYLYIEKERFGPRLNVIWDVDDTRGLYIPPLTIQPIVENAVKHGIIRKKDGGTIKIEIKNDEKNGRGHVLIEDDGVGMDEETMQQLLKRRLSQTSGVGLLNVHLRLRRLFGHGIHIESKQREGTRISFAVLHEKVGNTLHV